MREIDTGAQEAFIKEVNEDLKNESMKKLWDKYGLYIIILVAAALTAAVSFETIKAWHTKKNPKMVRLLRLCAEPAKSGQV